MAEMNVNFQNLNPIVEKGTNYIKYADGTIQEWVTINFSENINKSNGSMYISNDITVSVKYPIPFIGKPHVYSSINSDDAMYLYALKTDENGINGYILSRHSSLQVSGRIDVLAIGRWK